MSPVADSNTSASQPQPPPPQEQQQQQVPLRPLGPYFLGRTLGVGTFGKVVRGIHALTGEKVRVVYVCALVSIRRDKPSPSHRVHTMAKPRTPI